MTDPADDISRLEPWVAETPPRVIFEHRFHPTIVEENLRLPNGHRTQWVRYADHREGLERPDAVMGICQRGDDILLSRQYTPGAGKVVWEFPGGGTEPGEDYEEALRRELMEEVGFYPHRLQYLGRFLLNNRRSSRGIRTYLATQLEPRTLPADEAELIEWTFVKPGELDRLIVAGELDNATTLAGWALLNASRAGGQP